MVWLLAASIRVQAEKGPRLIRKGTGLKTRPLSELPHGGRFLLYSPMILHAGIDEYQRRNSPLSAL